MDTKDQQKNKLRIIKTARDVSSINEGAKNGFYPLIVKLKESKLLRQRYGVFQNRKTKEIEVSPRRSGYRQYDEYYSYNNAEWELVIPFTDHYPYYFRYEYPFAAYLIPKDLSIGEMVLIEDLIEDYRAGIFWEKSMRLGSCEAIWDGHNLIVQYDPLIHDVCNLMG